MCVLSAPSTLGVRDQRNTPRRQRVGRAAARWPTNEQTPSAGRGDPPTARPTGSTLRLTPHLARARRADLENDSPQPCRRVRPELCRANPPLHQGGSR